VNQKDPKSVQWTLGIQHTFWKDFTAEVRYLGTRGIHLNVQNRINAQSNVTNSVFLPTYTQDPGPAALDALPITLTDVLNNGDTLVPAFENAGFFGAYMVQFSPLGNSTYHGLASQLTKQMSNGVQFIASYTYSHTIDDSTADFFTTVLTPRRQEDFRNLSKDRANSALDRRHRLTVAVLYDMPYFKHSNPFLRNALGNWEFAPVYTYQTPEWLTVQSGRDVNLNGDSAGDRSIWNPSGVPGTGTDVTALTNSSGDVVAYLAKNPNAQYIRGGVGALTTTGRNTLASRPINNFDMSAVKRFTLTERYRVEFVAQALNLLNHPQFVPGSLNQVSSIGYTSGNVPNYLRPQSSFFNHPDEVFASNARALQLGLKLYF
jgi:hypothetical protein